jgi:hypothetical protein
MIEQEQIKPEEKRVLRSVLITLVYITVVLVFFIADLIALMIFSDTRFGLQISTIIGYTGLVSLYTFVRSRLGPGYSLHNPVVRQQLPRLMTIHCIFAGVIFFVHTFLIFNWSSLPATWFNHTSGPRHVPWFISLLLMVLVLAMMGEVLILRSILSRTTAPSAYDKAV